MGFRQNGLHYIFRAFRSLFEPPLIWIRSQNYVNIVQCPELQINPERTQSSLCYVCVYIINKGTI